MDRRLARSAPMKFSIFFEMQISEPDGAREARTFHDCVEQAVLADELGYHAVWEVEHHGLYEYSHSSAPEVFLAFVAARTKRIRLGHGVTLLPFRYNHPIRIAERVATLDVLSEGRVLWGSGKSSSLVEQIAFENDLKALHEQWAEAVEMIPRMWASDVFTFQGRFFNVAPTQILPKPIQKPHPPMFAACSKPESAVSVARMGLGALNFAFGSDDYLGQKVMEYRRAVAAAQPVGRAKNDWFACTPATLVLEDDREACRYGLRGARFFASAMAAYYFSGQRPVGRLDVPREFLPERDLEDAMAVRNAPGSQVAAIVGDPACARETVSRFADIGVDELILVMQMGTVPHELVMRSLRVLAEKVMPHFA
jgi:alkanesulfonate monooxygenase SsuD/methylene tetrahydromethanopterin reductase-like flavin-dependent oxidoreductase (luciferase family)